MTEQMQPGPELDGAVAERLVLRLAPLMGWKLHEAIPQRPYEIWESPEEVFGGEPPSWPTSWAAAGQVVERLAEDGWDVEIGYDSVSCTWLASFMMGEKWGVETVETAPHAISLAALAALEAK